MSGLPASFGETAQQKHRSGDQRSLEVDQVSAPPYAVRDGTVVPDQRLSLSRSPTDNSMCDSPGGDRLRDLDCTSPPSRPDIGGRQA